MEDIMNYIIIAGVAFWLGMKLATAWNTLAFKKVLEELGVKDTDLRALAEREGIKMPDPEPGTEPTLTHLEIRIEQHDGVLYAYRLDDDQFLGQGSDREQLIESLKHNLTNVKIIVDRDNGADYIR